jgi:hypothetical protein
VSPIDHFWEVWERCNQLSAMQAYLARNVATALRPDELLRAEWAARVSALDLYVHEQVAQRMLSIFEGTVLGSDGYATFPVPTATMARIRNAATAVEASAAFDLSVREQLGRKTYQLPDEIAGGIRLCSSCELWNEVALAQGSTPQSKAKDAKTLKQQLAKIVDRRNKIVHEGDLLPGVPRVPWPVSQADVAFVATFIEGVVRAIDVVL